MPELDEWKREELISRFLHHSEDGRRKLMAAMLKPTRATLSGYVEKLHGYSAAAVQIIDMLKCLDRLDAAMGPHEVREVFDVMTMPPFAIATHDGTPGGTPLTFSNWKAMLRLELNRIRAEHPDVDDLIHVADVMRT